MPYQVHTINLNARHLAVRKFAGDLTTIGQQMGEAFGAVMAYAGRAGVQVQGPAFAVYDMHPNGTFDVAAGFPVSAPVDGDGNVVPYELPACEAATTTHIGPYDALSDAYAAIEAWIKENSREPLSSIMWDEYWSGPEVPQDQARTEIFQPLKSR